MSAGTDPEHWVEGWLSAPRYAPYLATASGDRERALQLYEWNARASAALLHDLAHLEIGLRNTYDRALTINGGEHWVFDAAHYFPPVWRTARDGTPYDVNSKSRSQIADAVRKAGGRSSVPGKVIAELMFGFWRYLTTRAQHHPLWIPHLHRAFRAGTSRPQVDLPVGRLYQVRNRAAHHEPLLREDLGRHRRDILAVATLISRDLGTHIAEVGLLAAVIVTRPHP
ncbi:hypothetical protein D1871_11860 [Nakamurella silvestris]|nr:hypothetical protein D1871_11860 [Nakamurella silvestris]